MSCDVGEVTESLENELSSFSKISDTSPTSQLILQPFLRFTYVTTHSPTLPLLHLRHNSFSNPSFASPTSQDFHLRHLPSRPCLISFTIVWILLLSIFIIDPTSFFFFHFDAVFSCQLTMDCKINKQITLGIIR